MKLRALHVGNLNIDQWEIAPGETWCVLGGNASGKSHLAAVLAGERKAPGAIIEEAPQNVAWIAFETQQQQYERELAEDDTDFMDRIDYGSTGMEILAESGCSTIEARDAAAQLGLSHLLDRGCRQFSSGEIRRIQLLRALLAKPDLLILDEPFEGLDRQSCAAFSKTIRQFAPSGPQILLLVNRLEDVAPWTTHLALMRQGELVAQGPRATILASPACQQLLQLDTEHLPDFPPALDVNRPMPVPLFALRQVSVKYGDIYQFKGLSWTARAGEHTLITGPNGSGKSTLLDLISGNHPQCYCNDIRIFGYQRGSGESIWDIKRHIGLVSPSLHRDYRAGGSVITVVLSGFFDSIGLYQEPTRQQTRIATQWLAIFGLLSVADRPFRSLSYGQQRLALIARALVKQPPLLILDEPTQGLDDLNRHLVLAYLERLARFRATTLLFVSHREDEHISLFQRSLRFVPSADPSVRFEAEWSKPQ